MDVKEGKPYQGDDGVWHVHILWGSSNYVQAGDRPTEYTFATAAEMSAFLDGVEAAYGFMDYEITTADYVVPEEQEEDEGEDAL